MEGESVDLNTEIRLTQVDRSRQAPIEILATVKAYDPRLDLRWDAKYETWGLWRLSELGPLTFVCTIGPTLSGNIVKALEDEDTRRPGYDGLKRMREARVTAKRAMKERHDEIEAQIAHALSASSLEEQARRAQEVIQRYGKEG